ncbi:MAG: DUF3087 domain-containing protein [Gammaproteobacteria bacterium]|nr:DUF3087 domain-containing protein [Gammaproteobacteria bacterium]
MKLKEIDKARYRKHLNVVMICMAVALIVIAQINSALFIYVFSTPEASHFYHIMAAVAVSAGIVVFVVNKYRYHPYMTEVVYVWDLKQQLNKIQRKQPKLKPAIEKDDKEAMIIMNFMYRGSKQLYELDDNTITIEDLELLIAANDQRMNKAGLSLSTDLFKPEMLDSY